MTKYFNVNNPGNIVTITMDHGNFYQLSDGNMIKKETFDTKYQPVLEGFEHEIIQEKSTQILNSEYVDPTSFFSKTSSIDTSEIEKLKNVNTSGIPDVNDSNRTRIINRSENQVSENLNTESLVKEIRPEDVVIPNNTKTDVSNYKVYDNDDDAYNDFVKKSQNPIQEQKPVPVVNSDNKLNEINSLYEDEKLVYGEQEALNRKNKRLGKLNTNTTQTEPQQTESQQVIVEKTPVVQTIDPFTMMFSTFKRNHEVVFNIEFKDKIAKPEFIKMMMENMDGDIVGYYKKIIVENIKKNISIIEDVVESELKKIIFGEEEIEEKVEVQEVKQEIVEQVEEPKKEVKKRTARVVKKPTREE